MSKSKWKEELKQILNDLVYDVDSDHGTMALDEGLDIAVNKIESTIIPDTRRELISEIEGMKSKDEIKGGISESVRVISDPKALDKHKAAIYGNSAIDDVINQLKKKYGVEG